MISQVRNRTVVAILLAILIHAPCRATENEVAPIRGWGLWSCGHWTKLHDNKDPGAYAMDQWVLGFLTGSTTMRWVVLQLAPNPVEFHEPTQHIDNDGIVGWVTNYCRAHPTDTVFIAASHMTAPKFDPHAKAE